MGSEKFVMEKKTKKISAVIFVIIIFLIPIIFIFKDKKTFSEAENRKLAKKPDLKLSAIVDKSFMRDMDNFLSDNFPDRITWVKAKMGIDRIMGKEIINDIYLGDNMLIEKLPVPDYEEVDNSIWAINDFSQHYDTDVFFMLAPTSAGIYPEQLPKNAPQIDQLRFISYANVSFDDVNVINISGTMYSEKENYIYYRTDHHWTSYGAYLAYKQAASQLGFSPIDYDKFSIEHASENFRGTFYSKCFYDEVKEDTIDIYSYENGNKVKSVILNDGIEQIETDSIYFKDFLNKNDKYCVFLGQNRSYTNIKTDETNNKKILVIKDSYANSFIPFLVNHYSEIAVIDLRYVKTSITEFVNPDDYDQTLFLYNASTFSKETNIKMAGFFD